MDRCFRGTVPVCLSQEMHKSHSKALLCFFSHCKQIFNFLFYKHEKEVGRAGGREGYECVFVLHIRCGVYLEFREQLVGISSPFPPCQFMGSNSGSQV